MPPEGVSGGTDSALGDLSPLNLVSHSVLVISSIFDDRSPISCIDELTFVCVAIELFWGGGEWVVRVFIGGVAGGRACKGGGTLFELLLKPLACKA